MMYTQFAIFEVTDRCNLARSHSWCPCATRKPTGTQPMTDGEIVDAAVALYRDYGFGGMVGWHYYCEPLVARERMQRLMEAIREQWPAARFVLWTNGALLSDDARELHGFDRVHITEYEPSNAIHYAARKMRAIVSAPAIDDRLDTARVGAGPRPCLRMFTEIIFDYWGTVHACCYDWRGAIPLGTLRDGLPAVVDAWQSLRAELVAAGGMSDSAPAVCRACPHACLRLSEFDAAASARAMADGPVIRAMHSAPPHVVAVAYRIPEHRVRAFCEWNAELFVRDNATVWMVVEREYDGLPAWVRQVVFSEPMPTFSLTRTKNAGIDAALESGATGAVIASDIDIAFTPRAWDECRAVRTGAAVVPMYRMADAFDTRESRYVLAPLATGTVAVHADTWRACGVRYEPGCVGYGSDDAILLRDLQRASVRLDRCGDVPVCHIAHQQGTPQVEFAGRTDHWGRDTGFNPENFAHNRKFYER